MSDAILRSGTWLYAGVVPKQVDIVGMSYDFWYEFGLIGDQLEPGETPQPLDGNGFLYYVRFATAGTTDFPTWPDSGCFATIEDAICDAEERLPSPVVWAQTEPAYFERP